MSLSAALAAYYALDEASGTATAADSHTNAADLSTVVGTPTAVDPGHVGKARQFSGADVIDLYNSGAGRDYAYVSAGGGGGGFQAAWARGSNVMILPGAL